MRAVRLLTLLWEASMLPVQCDHLLKKEKTWFLEVKEMVDSYSPTISFAAMADMTAAMMVFILAANRKPLSKLVNELPCTISDKG